MKMYHIFIKSQPWLSYLWNANSPEEAWTAFIIKYPFFKDEEALIKFKDEELILNKKNMN